MPAGSAEDRDVAVTATDAVLHLVAAAEVVQVLTPRQLHLVKLPFRKLPLRRQTTATVDP